MKKTRLLLIGLLMAICAEGFAQDIIYTLDSRRIEAKVLEITDDDIRYKTFDNLEGPDYRMSLDRVVRIVFENGTEKVFSQVPLFVPNPYEGIGPYGSYGPYGPLSFHWGYYYDRRGRVYEEQLRDYLTQHGIFTTIRASRGQDIFAACGLLSTAKKIATERGQA